MQRGRKSPNATIVALRPTPLRPRLTPPTTLTDAERDIFSETAAQHPHLKPGDAMILAAFAQASVRSFKLAKKHDTAAWEKSVRAMLALARSLRLTPQSHTRAEALGRKDQPPLSYYDRMKHDEDR
jgi:hypothetical protein